jgi:preprotein translocase subunit SecE
MKTLLSFLSDVKMELGKVHWPTTQQTIRYTWLVIGVSVATALYLGAWDYIFGVLLKNII